MANIFKAKTLVSRTGIFSHEVIAPNLVYNTGGQNIDGLKNFTTRPTVNTTPVLLSGEAAIGLEQYVKNDQGSTVYKGQPVYIYGSNGNNLLARLASNTEEASSSKVIGLLKQDLAVNEFGYVVTDGQLTDFDTSLANQEGDPIWLGPTGSLIFGLTNKPYAPNHLVYLGVVERKHQNQGKVLVKVQNGFELQELHNVNIDHYSGLANNQVLKYNQTSGLWFNQTLSSSDLSNSNQIVYTTGNQIINGNKSFYSDIYIKNLFVTGTETIVNTTNFNVQSPYLLLNITGGAVDGGIFFVTGLSSGTSGTPLTGINDTGPIIGFDHSKNFKFGISTRNSDLSSLPDIASVQDIQNYSGVADNKFATIINLNSTGANLNTKLDNLSGVSVLTFGNQTISDNKTFSNTGSFNTLQITNKKLSSYSLNSTNFFFSDNYLNFANSSSNLTGILPSGIVSGINYYAKNLNSGIFLISGSGQRSIDGFSTLNLYKNESVQLVGVNSIGYTGWVTISTDAGIS